MAFLSGRRVGVQWHWRMGNSIRWSGKEEGLRLSRMGQAIGIQSEGVGDKVTEAWPDQRSSMS